MKHEKRSDILFSENEYRVIDDVRKIVGDKHRRYYIETFGCQMNVHDSEKLAGMLTAMGYDNTDDSTDADIIIFNTCCVREHAESKVFGHLGALLPLKTKNPDLVIAVCGCMMQQKDVALRIKTRFRFVDIIFGTHNLQDFPNMLFQTLQNRVRVFDVLDQEGSIIEGIPTKRAESVQDFVTIMYGCNNFCSYCIVPYVRGRERSRDINNILDEAKQLILNGTKEITVLGQNVNSYGLDLVSGITFADLLSKLAEIEGLERIRFMTSHPKDVSDELISVMATSPKVCNHIHLPVQSGSTKVLKAMNRKYTREDYLSLVKRMQDAIPNLEITTDIIVGFPGETEDDFKDTLDLVKEVGYSTAYTFKYSPRTGTPAAKMDDQIPLDVKKRRLGELNELVSSMIIDQNREYIGKTVQVLVEGVRENKDGEIVSYGRTTNSKMIYCLGEAKVGTMLDVKITHVKDVSLYGQPSD